MSRLQSGFNLDSFKDLFAKRGEEQKDLVYMARTAEAAERYDDMCRFMRELVEWSDKTKNPLSTEERNLLSVAYKNVIGARRASWRTLNAEADSGNDKLGLIKVYKEQVEEELLKICEDVLDLLENILVKNNTDPDEARVFYLKMTGDYYRYLAESVTEKGHEQRAADFYKQAFEIAESELKPTHPIRLGLALNYSVCFYEILKDKQAACDLAKSAFDEAISKLDKLEEADYKDSTLIMQLLRDNLTLWTSAENNDENDGVTVEDLSDEEAS
jgi:hypothetical protein